MDKVKYEIKAMQKLSANVIQEDDPEARWLRKNIIKPHEFKACNLKKFCGKTFMIDCRGLFIPLTFSFFGIRGDYTAFISTTHKVPNEVNGFEARFDQQ